MHRWLISKRACFPTLLSQGRQPRKSHPKNLKRCSHEVELKLAQGWSGADPGRTIAACTVPTPDPPGAQSPPHGRRRHPLPQVHAGATSTFPGSQRQGAARYRLTLTRLERTAGCSGARRGGELQSPNHEQGALAGCPGSGPGGGGKHKSCHPSDQRATVGDP